MLHMKKAFVFEAIFSLVLLGSSSASGQTLNTLDRPYDVLVLRGSDVPQWLGERFDAIQPRFYRYDAAADVWTPLPFQFDNSNPDEADPTVNEQDEFLFMAPDMGDQAPPEAWVPDNASKLYGRIEVRAADPLNPGRYGWIYLYRSSTLPLSTTKYLHYTAASDQIESDVYIAGHGVSGFQSTLKLKTEAGGDNLDFLDRQKFRLHLHAKAYGLDTDFLLKEQMDETVQVETGVNADIVVRKQRVDVIRDGTIRLQRNLTLYGEITIRVGGIELYHLDGEFVFPTVYYPHYANWQTPNIPIAPSEDYDIRGIRLSVDMNDNAKGMQFVNPFNTRGALIDGEMDDLDLTMNWPGWNWHMAVADPDHPLSSLTQATLLNIIHITGDAIGDVRGLHYVDNSDYYGGDTGDKRAIGDSGVRVTGSNITGELAADMALFYLADNLTLEEAELLSQQYANPPVVELTEQEPPYVLTVLADPADAGQITVDPDQVEYAAGTLVRLTAEAGSGFDFSNWSGDASGSANPVDVIMDGNKTVTAHFVTLRQITVRTDPDILPFEVNGAVYTAPATFGLLDGDTLSVCVDSTHNITLGARYAFQHWSDSGAVCHDYIVPHRDDTLTAVFRNEHQLAVSIDPDSAGEVLISPLTEGLWYASQTDVSLLALPVYGTHFDRWTGALTGAVNPAQLTMNSFKRVTAHFEPDTQMVTVRTDPDTLPFTVDDQTYVGSETFAWRVGSAHALCADSLIQADASVRLAFTGWSHDSSRCHTFVVPDEDRVLTADFRDQYLLTAVSVPDTAGRIRATPGGDFWYDAGTSVELEAVPAPGFAFLNWADSLSGHANPADMIMDGPMRVTAVFGNRPPTVVAPDTSFAEDDTLRIGFDRIGAWVSDENNPDSTLHVVVTGGSRIAALMDSSASELLLYTRTPDWNGTDTVTVWATDPLGQTASDGMTVLVLPVPDAPLPFALLEPGDQSVFPTWPDIVTFSWRAAADPDAGDTLTYVMEIDTTDRFDSPRHTVIPGIQGSTYPLVWPSKWEDHVYFWRVTAVDTDDLSVLCSNGPFRFTLATGVQAESEAAPKTFVLDQNYPNPFNGETVIRYGLPKNSPVRLHIYNMFGQKVKTLVESVQARGYHTVQWNGTDDHGGRVASGLYFIRLRTPSFESVKKTILTQ